VAIRRHGIVQDVIIWLNGAFGVGKSTTAALLPQKSQALRTFDPEWVGYMLRENLSDYPVTDSRHWDPWRRLTPIVADEIIRFSGQSLVAPQTVLEEEYWDELLRGLSGRGHEVFHVLLDAEPEVMLERIRADRMESTAKQWRINHLSDYTAARPWLAKRADLTLDTTGLAPHQVADRIWEGARGQIAQV